MSFGSTIKRLRKENNLTQDQLANLLNVTPQAISRWENNSALPDISLLIPLANIFKVTTDTLLEVDLEKNEKHIEEYALYAPAFKEPYGTNIEEKLAIYREEVRKHPNSARLKEALIVVLGIAETIEGAYPDLSYAREKASLTEDIIEMGGGLFGLEYHKSQLVYLSRQLSNTEKAYEIASSAPRLDACKEVLLPSSLQGREQIDARKDLIFKCTDTIIQAVYSLLDDNANDLSKEELSALRNVESIVTAVYGKSFSDHFVLPQTLYKGVKGALKRGEREEAVKRLAEIVDHMSLMERETPHISPLILEKQIDTLYLAFLAVYSISNEAKLLLEEIDNDFSFDGEDDYREANNEYGSLYKMISALTESDGGQLKKDAEESLARMYERKRKEKQGL